VSPGPSVSASVRPNSSAASTASAALGQRVNGPGCTRST
jgi:hypothetical protein